jgi:DNA anti-recombination protein RmuC
MQMREKLFDLQKYSASIADGAVSIDDLMNAPSSMFQRMSIFATYSHNASMAGAQEKISMMAASGMLNTMMTQIQPQQQGLYQNMILRNLYDQEREKFKTQETKLLNMQETKMQQETAKLEEQLKMLEAEESKLTSAIDKAAEKSAPGYVA